MISLEQFLKESEYIKKKIFMHLLKDPTVPVYGSHIEKYVQGGELPADIRHAAVKTERSFKSKYTSDRQKFNRRENPDEYYHAPTREIQKVLDEYPHTERSKNLISGEKQNLSQAKNLTDEQAHRILDLHPSDLNVHNIASHKGLRDETNLRALKMIQNRSDQGRYWALYDLAKHGDIGVIHPELKKMYADEGFDSWMTRDPSRARKRKEARLAGVPRKGTGYMNRRTGKWIKSND